MPQDAQAYAFGVSPIRLDFNRSTRTAALTVSNDDEIALSFQVRLVRWTQDSAGEDRYEDSKDLIYFPRLMKVEPREKRVIRLGTQRPPDPIEGTYRLIVEEMLPPAQSKGQAATVAVRMRFAVPVFVAPPEPVTRVDMQDVGVDKGEVRFQLKNSGNTHVKVDSIALRRGGATVGEAAGWYVLAGATRKFGVALTATACEGKGPFELVVKGEGLDLKREVVMDAGRCRP